MTEIKSEVKNKIASFARIVKMDLVLASNFCIDKP